MRPATRRPQTLRTMRTRLTPTRRRSTRPPAGHGTRANSVVARGPARGARAAPAEAADPKRPKQRAIAKPAPAAASTVSTTEPSDVIVNVKYVKEFQWADRRMMLELRTRTLLKLTYYSYVDCLKSHYIYAIIGDVRQFILDTVGRLVLYCSHIGICRKILLILNRVIDPK